MNKLRGLRFVFAILGILFLINLASALSCGDTITENITLSESLVCSGNALVIGADNLVIDGNGYTLEGDGTGTGIYVFEKSGVEIKNFEIKNFESGIGLIDKNDKDFVHDSKINDNKVGVLVSVLGTNNHFLNNEFRDNEVGLNLVSFSDSNMIENNKFIYNRQTGVRILQSWSNILWKNKFIQNKVQVEGKFVSPSSLSVDNVGNYWDDFESNPGYPSQYIIPKVGTDQYPYWFQAKCGDLNNDNKVTISDIAILKDFVFGGGDPPVPIWTADINGDHVHNILDVVSLINYALRGKAKPSCGMTNNKVYNNLRLSK